MAENRSSQYTSYFEAVILREPHNILNLGIFVMNPSIQRTIYWRILYQNIFENGGGGGNNISYLAVECSTELII